MTEPLTEEARATDVDGVAPDADEAAETAETPEPRGRPDLLAQIAARGGCSCC